MASILTVERIKDVLNIPNDFSTDPLIESILPSVKNWVVDFCKNPFLVQSPTVSISGNSLSIDASTPKIEDSDSGFVTVELTANTDILIQDSRFNDGVYFITGVAAATLTIDSIYARRMTSEDYSDESFIVHQIVFPSAILLPVAQIVYFDMQKRNPDLQSFRLADYSETYGGGGDYPPGLRARFTPWRNLY